jgi:hypothetical protein
MSALDRAELYSTDSSGKRVAKVDKHQIGYGVMPVKETPRHALSQANTTTTDDQLEDERREREARRKFDAMPAGDRELLRLSLVRTTAVERRMPFPAGQREGLEASGWHFVKYEGKGNRSALMVKSFVGQLTHAHIAECVGLSVYQVRRRLAAMDALLVRYAELRGWL